MRPPTREKTPWRERPQPTTRAFAPCSLSCERLAGVYASATPAGNSVRIELSRKPSTPGPSINSVWTVFPHVSIACFAGVSAVEESSYQGVMLSQLFPGREPGESYTVQNFLVDRELTPEQAEAATQQFEFLKGVVRDEDYATGIRQQDALRTGSREFVLFGRNEEGGQLFHDWVDRILETEDDELPALFAAS